MNIYNNTATTDQQIYNYYNNFIFSNDSKVFNKMVKRIELFIKTKEIVGDIWELGVFKGSGVALWSKLKKMYDYNSSTKIVGVDFFEPQNCLLDLSGNNKEKMNDVLSRVKEKELLQGNIQHKLSKINKKDVLLLKGEAGEICMKYINKNPGVKIKLLYMDLDLGEPTYNVLKCLWKNISLNGIVVFDEYAFHCWDECIGVDRFLKEIPNQYKYCSTKIFSPSMYIIKTVL